MLHRVYIIEKDSVSEREGMREILLYLSKNKK